MAMLAAQHAAGYNAKRDIYGHRCINHRGWSSCIACSSRQKRMGDVEAQLQVAGHSPNVSEQIRFYPPLVNNRQGGHVGVCPSR